eukprot:2512906-Rhodomonas_salina.1
MGVQHHRGVQCPCAWDQEQQGEAHGVSVHDVAVAKHHGGLEIGHCRKAHVVLAISSRVRCHTVSTSASAGTTSMPPRCWNTRRTGLVSVWKTETRFLHVSAVSSLLPRASARASI